MTQHPDTADAFLLFGATGDLARKKIFPALYKLFQTERMRCPIIGISRTDWTDEQLRERARQSIREQSDSPADESGLNDFCSQLRYVAGEGFRTHEHTRHVLHARHVPLRDVPFKRHRIVEHSVHVGDV